VGRLAKAAASLLPGFLANRLFFSTSPSPAELEKLSGHRWVIRRILGEPAATISFATGTPGLHRKMVAQASAHGAVRAYVKITPEFSLCELLDNEKQALAFVRASSGVPFQVPRVLADVREEGYRYLFLGPPEKGARPRPVKPDRLDELFLGYWASRESSWSPIEEVLAGFTPPADLATEESRTLSDARDFVHGFFQPGGVRVWPSHGDYAPWNTLLLRDGGLYVFDWEYFDAKAPALRDIFHRVFMPSRLVEGLPPAQVVRRLLAVPGDPVLGPVVARAGLNKEELPAYLILYLLEMVRRQGVGEQSSFSYLTACLDRVLLKVGFKGRRPKVLVSAYACEPGKGSEPEVGWQWVQAIAKHADAWVITKGNNRGPIEKALGAAATKGLHFEYVELPRWLTFWKKGQRGVRLYYYLWQFAALARARGLLRDLTFDLGHHVTFVNANIWTFLALLPIPFIWGPIGSNIGLPKQLLGRHMDLFQRRWIRAIQSLIRLLDPLYWCTARRAVQILCINDRVARTFPLRLAAKGKIRIEPAIAIDNSAPATSLFPNDPIEKRDGLRVLFVGRFVAIKGPDLALEAFARFVSGSPAARLTMVGEGPLLENIKQQAINLKIADKVTCIPWLPRDEVLRVYKEHDVFLFPSMEGGGMVVLEAMAAGLPVVCLDYGGPGQMVTPETGIKVPVGPRAQVIAGLAQALVQIAREEGWRDAAARRRIQEVVRQRYSWERKARLIADLYQSLI
jgi:glycosyltransferase involved in cell wall biosynthesis